MYSLPPPLLAMHDVAEIFTVLVSVVPFWVAVITITLTVVHLKHRQRCREIELGAAMVHDMLGRKMATDEIERVLCAWAGRKSHLKKLVRAREQAYAPSGKPIALAG
jgi:hypothetical protein